MRVFTFDQLSPEWFAIRRGVPTASCFSKIITPAKGNLSESADKYIYQLIGERVEPYFAAYELDYTNDDMDRGRELEPEARGWFQMEFDEDVEQVGFVMSDCGRFGASPDGLYRNRTRGLEIKCPRASTHAAWLMGGKLPDKHKVQCHGGMAVSGLNEWSFVSYVPEDAGLDRLVVTVERDSFTDRLSNLLEEFHQRYLEIAQRLGVELTPLPAAV